MTVEKSLLKSTFTKFSNKTENFIYNSASVINTKKTDMAFTQLLYLPYPLAEFLLTGVFLSIIKNKNIINEDTKTMVIGSFIISTVSIYLQELDTLKKAGFSHSLYSSVINSLFPNSPIAPIGSPAEGLLNSSPWDGAFLAISAATQDADYIIARLAARIAFSTIFCLSLDYAIEQGQFNYLEERLKPILEPYANKINNFTKHIKNSFDRVITSTGNNIAKSPQTFYRRYY